MKCDIKGCKEEGNSPLTRYINLCGYHWYMIMNGIMEPPYYLQQIEKDRMNEIDKD